MLQQLRQLTANPTTSTPGAHHLATILQGHIRTGGARDQEQPGPGPAGYRRATHQRAANPPVGYPWRPEPGSAHQSPPDPTRIQPRVPWPHQPWSTAADQHPNHTTFTALGLDPPLPTIPMEAPPRLARHDEPRTEPVTSHFQPYWPFPSPPDQTTTTTQHRRNALPQNSPIHQHRGPHSGRLR